MKILIIGAVAAGTSAAAKARRNDEQAEIKIFDIDSDISYSACGLPYFIGGDVGSRDGLVPRDAGFFKSKYNIDIMTGHQVLRIEPADKMLVVQELASDAIFKESYDKLIIATGARPLLPHIEGIDADNVFLLRNVKSAEKIKAYIETRKPVQTVIIGSGFIGLEMAENLAKIGISVTVIEMEEHLMKPLDKDIARSLEKVLSENGVAFHLNDPVVRIEGESPFQRVLLASGKSVEADMIILAAGIRPDAELAAEAGIELGKSGAIKVNNRMETNIPDIYACGDCAESYSLVNGAAVYRPLGSTANKMGRIAGDQATGGDLEFRGILGTGIFRLFGCCVAQTGLSEQEAKKDGREIVVCHNIKTDRPEYFQGEEMTIKAIADKASQKLLGVQIVGKSGVDKRIDVFATAITYGAVVSDLFHLDLAYAPPFSTAKDPVMYTGMILTNELQRGRRLITSDELMRKIRAGEKMQIVDTRTPGQYLAGHIAGAVNVPHANIRERLSELDKDAYTVTYCNKGTTGNAVQNILINNGFPEVYNLSGGYNNFMISAAAVGADSDQKIIGRYCKKEKRQDN